MNPKTISCEMGFPKPKTSSKAGRKLARQRRPETCETFNPMGPIPHMVTNRTQRDFTVTVQLFGRSVALTPSTTVEQSAIWNAALDLYPEAGQYSTIFDQYRIDCIEMWLTPSFTTTFSAYPEAGVYCTAMDYDGAPSATFGFSDIASLPGSQITPIHVAQYRKFKPMVLRQLNLAAETTGYETVDAPWIDILSSDVPHYGVRMACTTCTATLPIMQMTRATITFRGIHLPNL